MYFMMYSVYQCVNSLDCLSTRTKKLDPFYHHDSRSVGESGRLTNSMNVVLAVVGIVVVNDELHIIHVQTSGGNISGDEDGALATLELPQHPVSLLLLLVPVDAHSGPAVTSHQPADIGLNN